MKPVAPRNAAAGASESPRRNQYIANPATMTFTRAGRVSASEGGRADIGGRVRVKRVCEQVLLAWIAIGPAIQ